MSGAQAERAGVAVSREWRIEGTIRQASLGVGVIISEGFNDRRDGPERYVGDVFRATPEDLAIMLAAPALLEACKQLDAWWCEDFTPPEAPDERRILTPETVAVWFAIRAAIAKATQP